MREKAAWTVVFHGEWWLMLVVNDEWSRMVGHDTYRLLPVRRANIGWTWYMSVYIGSHDVCSWGSLVFYGNVNGYPGWLIWRSSGIFRAIWSLNLYNWSMVASSGSLTFPRLCRDFVDPKPGQHKAHTHICKLSMIDAVVDHPFFYVLSKCCGRWFLLVQGCITIVFWSISNRTRPITVVAHKVVGLLTVHWWLLWWLSDG